MYYRMKPAPFLWFLTCNIRAKKMKWTLRKWYRNWRVLFVSFSWYF